jgi:hypothetical protein
VSTTESVDLYSSAPAPAIAAILVYRYTTKPRAFWKAGTDVG